MRSLFQSILILFVALVAATCQRVSEPSKVCGETDDATEQILDIVKKDGLVNLSVRLRSNHLLSFPAIHSAEYLAMVEEGDNLVERMLGEAVIGKIEKLRPRLLGLSEARFIDTIQHLQFLCENIAEGEGHGNLVLAQAINHLITDALLERLILNPCEPDTMKILIRANASDPFDWQQVCRVFEHESNRTACDNEWLKTVDADQIYLFMYGAFRYGRNEAQRALADFVVWDTVTTVDDNWRELKLDNFIGMILSRRMPQKSLELLHAMQTDTGVLPDDREEFSALALNSLPSGRWITVKELGQPVPLTPDHLWAVVRQAKSRYAAGGSTIDHRQSRGR